jgi:biopolymer transport protein ExbD
MARLRPKHTVKVEVPMAAMSDVAFLLIIFFIVASSFSRSQKLPVELPGDKIADSSTAKPSRPPSVRITESRLFLNDSPLEGWQLTADLRTLLIDKSQPSDRVVILRADENVPMERVVEIMDAIRSADAVIGILELEGK